MDPLDERHLKAIETLATALNGSSIPWALTGSTSFALQGVPVTPNDIDVQTTEKGAYVIEKSFEEQILDPVSFSESETIRSHFGALELNNVRVEIIGAIEKRQPDGTWGPPIDITEHRTFLEIGDVRIPALSLQYEAEAYEKLGREERAALLAEYAQD